MRALASDTASPPAPSAVAPTPSPLPVDGWRWALGLAAWAAFSAWLVWGFPPCVDLPGHAAQIETLDALLRGDPAVASVYRWRVPIGYGLAYWLGLPLAYLWNGAVAARVLLWASLVLHPIAWATLLRTLGRSLGILPCLLPFAFGIAYWYGFLPSYFTEPLVFFALALLLRTLSRPSAAGIAALNALGLVVAQSHLFMFAVLLILAGCAALAKTGLARAVRWTAGGFAAPLLVCVPRAWEIVHRAVSPGTAVPTEYAAMSHLNWFFKNYRPEGKLAAFYPLVAAILFVLLWLWRRHPGPSVAFALFAGSAVLYALLPKTLSGVFGVSIRLPVVTGVLALCLVDWRSVPRVLQALLLGLALFSLGETARFHWRFAHAVDGLDEMIARASGRADGYVSTVGDSVLGSKHIYLAHLGAWITATRGGIGQNFFADAEQVPVRQRVPGVPPADLSRAPPEQLAPFETISVFGPPPFPGKLAAWQPVARAGAWTLLRRPDGPASRRQ